MTRHIFLLTDGAVSDYKQVIQLIDDRAIQTNSRVHSFGIGSGASIDLVKESAQAGCGSHFFIYNNNEIEEKVILALQRNFLPIRLIEEVVLVDRDNKILENLKGLIGRPLSEKNKLAPEKQLNISIIAKDEELANLDQIRLKIFDPNTEKSEWESVKVTHATDSNFKEMIGHLCGQQTIRSLPFSLEKQEVEKMKCEISKLFNVLHYSTSMIAKLKLTEA